MRKYILLIFTLLASLCVQAQDAKKTMDKAAKVLAGSCISANYSAKGYLTESGSLTMKGTKFCVRSSTAIVWFDGKTQWTYSKSTNEVNVTNYNPKKPTVVNPMVFVGLYKKGYTLTQKKVAAGTEVYMKSDGKQTFSEVYVTLNAKSLPVQVRFKTSKGWTTVTLSNYQTKKLPDSAFRFNKKEFPNAEVIDLR